MPVVAVDDTDSREAGMCTTYVGAELAERLRRAGHDVTRLLLVRCNPAIEHKTRGNAAVAVHVDEAGPAAGDGSDEEGQPAAGAGSDYGAGARNDGGRGSEEPSAVEELLATARETVDDLAAVDDPATNPGVVVAPSLGATDDATGVDEGATRVDRSELAAFARDAVRDRLSIDDAVDLAECAGFRTAAWGNGRGRIGALAAIGAWHAHDDWTYERLAYRERERWGTERDVDAESVRAAADEHYPAAWDTVDGTTGDVVCVPHTPGPVLFGIRGDDPEAVEAVAAAIDSEPVARAETFVTNQGTDAHVRHAPADEVEDGRCYRVDGVVVETPETRRGGHVFLAIERDAADPEDRDADATAGTGAGERLECVAFEPTGRFRDRVRALRAGDAVTVVGEVADGTCKLEKFALREPVRTEPVNPTCPDCGRRMESAGADAGYRCRDCDATAEEPASRELDRDIEPGWYEVPPAARRHVAKPLVRGGFDAPTHPER